MNKQVELNFVTFLLEHMEPLKDNPDREKFCVGFDEAFKRDKQWYKELTGKEWQNEDA